MHVAALEHPLAKLGPAFAEAFNLAPVPRPGDGNTPNNTRHDDNFRQIHGASYRHVFDLADWDKGLATSTPGQSGQPSPESVARTMTPTVTSASVVNRVRPASFWKRVTGSPGTVGSEPAF